MGVDDGGLRHHVERTTARKEEVCLAKELGREIATPDEAREILGMAPRK